MGLLTRLKRSKHQEELYGPLGLTRAEEQLQIMDAIHSGRLILDDKREDVPSEAERDQERSEKLERLENAVVETGDSMLIHPEFSRGQLVKFATDVEDAEPYQVIAYIVDAATGGISYRLSSPMYGWKDVSGIEIEPYERGVDL